MNLAALAASPNALAAHYQRFRVADRALLTGHSHQAWPDCAMEGQLEAWSDAAAWLDEKWDLAFQRAKQVKKGFASLLGDDADRIALGSSTHELVVRFLSALPLRQRRRLITTDGEFHTLRRQLSRLSEEGIELIRVPADPVESLAPRLSQVTDDRTAAVLVSAVLFETGRIVPGLDSVLRRCQEVGAELLVDVYHALNVVPFSLADQRLGSAFVVGGGYKYCQLGEGNCFLRIPPGCRVRPVVTGWFAEFSALAEGTADGTVWYPEDAERFAGATYDPTSHYRAARVFAFFEGQDLSPSFLRQVSQHQLGVLVRMFDGLDPDPRVVERDRETPLAQVGGFLALRSPMAALLGQKLREAQVLTDYRGEWLRLGPAPYLSDRQLEDAVAALGAVLKTVK
ncbi:MAG TPA: hypothetical protein VLT17_10155 [Gemmatimonadales bacterium]|jgi:kynureninase|nr:hypothetical protein [Gemmatimonadales bacterium]